jgi:lipoprotein-anchoring transpeptidase ErfK/SrfK
MTGLRTFLTSALAAAALAVGADAASATMSGYMQLASLVPDSLADNTQEVPGPSIVARVDLSDQRMYVYRDEKLVYTFPVSSGRRGYGTPTGQWNAYWLSPKHRSRKYNNAPMPWAVFFNGGYAVHGTTDLRNLGRPASHGCIRLHPDNAKTFFRLVQTSGKESALISIVH